MNAQAKVLTDRTYMIWITGIALVLLILIVSILYKQNTSRRTLNNRLEEMVASRTKELELQQVAMTRLYTELKFESQYKKRLLRKHLSTAKGISYLAELESREPEERDQFKNAGQKAEDVLKRLKEDRQYEI